MNRLFIFMFMLCFACNPANEEATSQIEAIDKTEEAGDFTQEYYDEGGLKTEGRLVDGKRNGLWVSYFPNGTIWSESTYKMNILHGKTKVYYPSGVMRYKGKFRDGSRAGKWIEYLEDGKVDFIKEYPE